MIIGTMQECRRHLLRHRRGHPAALLITNLIERSKGYSRADVDRRKKIAKHMKETMRRIENFKAKEGAL